MIYTDNKLSETVGKRINTLLAKKDKKQKELAAYLQVQDNTISYFVSGRRIPNTEQIIKISDFFGVSADYLLGRTNIQTTNENLQFVCNYTGLNEDSVKTLSGHVYDIRTTDILNLLLSEEKYFDFYLFCKNLRNYRKQYDSLTGLKEAAVKCTFNASNKHNSLTQARQLIDKVNEENDKKDLSEYRLIKDFKSFLDEYCKTEFEKYAEISLEYQKARQIANKNYEKLADMYLNYKAYKGMTIDEFICKSVYFEFEEHSELYKHFLTMEIESQKLANQIDVSTENGQITATVKDGDNGDN